MDNHPFVEMADINKSFSGNQVLKNVNFTVNTGEIHALMGENGAGKSTLIKIMTGIHQRDSGTVSIKGEDVQFTNPKEAENHGISVIHQELNIIPYLTVTQNMFLGKEITYKKTGVLNKKAMQRITKDNLERLGVTSINPNTLAGHLSVGQQQMVEIAKALATNAEMIIMDEPTAALTERETENLFKVVDSLKQQQVSIVYISHRLEEIFRICENVTVLRDGEYIGSKAIKQTTHSEVVKMMVGRELGEQFPEQDATIGDVVLSIDGLSRKEMFSDITFSVKSGEILGVAGLMGAGRSEIMETIFGYTKKDSGSITLNGEELNIHHPREAIKSGIGFITEDRKSKGLVINASIRENIALTNLQAISNAGVISRTSEKQLIDELMNRLNVRATGSEQEVKSLSGGNQQKVVAAKWLGIQPKLLILDEPTRGVDVGAKKEIYTIIQELTRLGVAIIMISSELPEVLGVSDRIMVIHEGKVSGFLEKNEADQEKIMTLATGGNTNEENAL